MIAYLLPLLPFRMSVPLLRIFTILMLSYCIDHRNGFEVMSSAPVESLFKHRSRHTLRSRSLKSFLAIYGPLQASRLSGAADSKGYIHRVGDLIYGPCRVGRG